MSEEETEEFGALEEALLRIRPALAIIARRRDKLRNRFVMRAKWRNRNG